MCTNASWALGEIAVKVGPEMRPFAPAAIDALARILFQEAQEQEDEEDGNETTDVEVALLENVSITLGRLALVCPDLIAQRYVCGCVWGCMCVCRGECVSVYVRACVRELSL